MTFDVSTEKRSGNVTLEIYYVVVKFKILY